MLNGDAVDEPFGAAFLIDVDQIFSGMSVGVAVVCVDELKIFNIICCAITLRKYLWGL